ncbi:hypothetical protein BGZ94_006440, partial [Podila epigama]
QFQGAFEWDYSDPETGETKVGTSKCKVILLVGSSAAPGAGGAANSEDSDIDPLDEDEPRRPDEIYISDKTKMIVIGVGCAVGALVLAGFVGFYVIRYGNKRAAKETAAQKLREPIQSGPLFPPVDRPGRGTKYNELSSVTTGSVGAYSPTSTTRTEMVDMSEQGKMANSPAFNSRSATPIAPRNNNNNGISRPSTPTPIAAMHASSPSRAASPILTPGSPTPIAAMHARVSPPSMSAGEQRPTSLLTSSFTPYEESSSTSRTPSPAQGRNPFEEAQHTQQQHHQSSNYYS